LHIASLNISNFRKLKQVRIDFEQDVTLLVGANNSGKSSAMECIAGFTGTKSFSVSDIAITDLEQLNEMGAVWEGSGNDRHKYSASWGDILPSLDLWIEADTTEAALLRPILPLLNDFTNKVGVQYRLFPRNGEALRESFCNARSEAIRLEKRATDLQEGEPPIFWPANLTDFLQKDFAKYFVVQYHPLDPEWSPLSDQPTSDQDKPEDESEATTPNEPPAVEPISDESPGLPSDPLAELLQVDFVNAQRLSAGTEEASLSQIVNSFYRSYLHDPSRSSDEDISAIAAALRAQGAFDVVLKAAFRNPLDEVRAVGYPGVGNPELVIRTDIDIANTLNHTSVLKYAASADAAPHSELPETFNGLGYRNLVLMMFRLMSFRLARRADSQSPLTNRPAPPLHLVLLEEPEAHLHPQVQQVFVRHAHRALTGIGDELLGAQLLVSTHSSHLAHELDFEAIRYFKRTPSSQSSVQVVNLKDTFGKDKRTKQFVTRYLKLHHSNTLFADALIIVEGNAERLLLPHFLETTFPTLASNYIEIVEIGGAHAHRLKPLIETLGIPTLVITDIDAADPGNSSEQCAPQRNAGHVTTNSSLTSWLGSKPSLDELFKFESKEYLHTGQETLEGSLVYFAHQNPREYNYKSLNGELIASTFEDAIAFDNLALFHAEKGHGFSRKIFDAADAALERNDLTSLASTLFAALKSADKSRFALDALLEQDALVPPSYVADGLTWLDDVLRRFPNLKSVTEATS
jgi:predicted ATP-dependent endonuclease of OLD family